MQNQDFPYLEDKYFAGAVEIHSTIRVPACIEKILPVCLPRVYKKQGLVSQHRLMVIPLKKKVLGREPAPDKGVCGSTFVFPSKTMLMRKLIFQEFLSLDGYAADKNHSTKFFEHPEFSEDSDDDLLKEMDRFDTILLGANTYKMFVEFAPNK